VKHSYLFIFLFSFAAQIAAQPVLDFKKIDVQYPDITLTFKVSCKGKFVRNFGTDFEVRENGALMKDITLVCPPTDDCCVSVALVFDRSGSMSTNDKMDNVKRGGHSFVASMNPDSIPCDEACIVSFNELVTLNQPMTSDKKLLDNTINTFVANGYTAVWDAVGTGIQELQSSAKNRCKAVVVLTDGGDNHSKIFYNVNQLITYATQQGVKVYTIGFDMLPGSFEEQNLQALADATDGEYFRAGVSTDLAAVYAMIKEKVRESFQECTITYKSICPDGTRRVVDLTVKGVCNGTATQTKAYYAPLDKSQFTKVLLRLGDAKVDATGDVLVPVTLETPVNGIFSKGNFVVVYDKNAALLTGLSTTGTLLQNTPVTMQDVGYGTQIMILQNTVLAGNGMLLYLRFRAGDLALPTTINLWLNKWDMDAYCLLPELMSGTLQIKPREPLIQCEILVPNKVVWDDNQKEYVPNPFTATVTVRNIGNREARNVRAHIQLNSSALSLVSPTVADQLVSPLDISPGNTSSASWSIKASKLDNLDSLSVYFSIVSDNHPQIACWDKILINPALTPELTCSLSTPDTIYFREQYYEPGEFDIGLQARNTGSGQTRNVQGQLLQDTRFTILTPASLSLAPQLLPTEQAGCSFRVQIHPRENDGYDTVRVNVQGSDSDPAWCLRPIFVQRERAPKFSLVCTTPEDSLVFSDVTYDYVPNPFEVTTIATNIGETYAEECQLMFIGPPRFTPVGTNLRPEGTMQVNDTRTEKWLIRALPRTFASWDTLVFQVLGKGGLGRKIVIGECRLPVFVPAIRKPLYEANCSSPDSLAYTNNQYVPDPFVLSSTIKNIGNATGRNLTTTIILPAEVVLAQGESPGRHIDELRTGDSVTISWNVSPISKSTNGLSRLCAQVVDSLTVGAQCCTDVFIPRAEDPKLILSCWAPDSLYIDPNTGQYVANPFDVILNITNIGLGDAENIRANIAPLGSYVTILDSSTKFVGSLSPGNYVRITWKVKALKRLTSDLVPLALGVTSSNHPTKTCDRSVYLPALLSPALAIACASTPRDSMLFNWDIGDFDPREGSVTATVTNTGPVQARNVSVLLVVPSGIALATGEITSKALQPAILDPGNSGTVTWRFHALRQNDDALLPFKFIASCDNADEAQCNDNIWIQGSPRHITLTLPTDLLYRFGQKGTIPVAIDKTIGKDLTSYSFELHYDPAVISLLHVTNIGTLTELGWVGAVMQPLAAGRVRISDYTTSRPLATNAGTLVHVDIEGVYSNNPQIPGFAESMLHIPDTSALFNAGDITVATIDGSIIVTNQCLEPLHASEYFNLEQNRPNPFNPQTTISFTLGKADRVRLSVYNPMGRLIGILVDKEMDPGKHSVQFDCRNCASGMYFYRLESSGATVVRKMILAQ
jgi:hypothetical protein